MHIALLEDSQADRRLLTQLLQQWAQERGRELQLSAYSDAASFLSAALMQDFDFMLLDCYLGESDENATTGMDIARELRANGNAGKLVFTTSSLDFAVEGYEVSAAGYLLKPISYEKLARLLDKELAASAAAQNDASRLITIPTKYGETQLNPDLILWCRAQGHYLNFKLHQGRQLRCRMTFTELAQALENDPRFYISARDYLVNLDEASSIDDEAGFILKNGDSVPIARARLSQARIAFAEHVFTRMRG